MAFRAWDSAQPHQPTHGAAVLPAQADPARSWPNTQCPVTDKLVNKRQATCALFASAQTYTLVSRVALLRSTAHKKANLMTTYTATEKKIAIIDHG
jgi:hypothetical protein